MTPADALDLIRNMIAENGEIVLVRRQGGAGPARTTTAEAAVLARVIGVTGGGQQLVGAVLPNSRKVILLNDPDAAVAAGQVALATLLPLTDRDKLVINGVEVAIQPGGVDDDTRRIAGVLIAIDVLVKA